MTTHDDIRSAVANSYNVMHRLSIFDYAGDVSVRPEGSDFFYIRSARVTPDAVVDGNPVNTSPADIISVALSGKVIDGQGHVPIETAIHASLYAAYPRFRSVVHAHPRMVVVLSLAGIHPDPIYIRGADVTGPRLARYSSSDTVTAPSEVAELVSLLASNDACLLPGHGVVVGGTSLEEACVRVIAIEQSAHMQYLAMTIGRPKSLPSKSLERRLQAAKDPNMVANIWSYYAALVAVPAAGSTAAKVIAP